MKKQITPETVTRALLLMAKQDMKSNIENAKALLQSIYNERELTDENFQLYKYLKGRLYMKEFTLNNGSVEDLRVGYDYFCSIEKAKIPIRFKNQTHFSIAYTSFLLSKETGSEKLLQKAKRIVEKAVAYKKNTSFEYLNSEINEFLKNERGGVTM